MRLGVDPARLDVLVRASEALLPELTAPARSRPGVCSTCRTWSDTDTEACSNCAQTAVELGAPALALSVVSLYRKPSALREWLTGYKGSADGAEPLVPAYRHQVAAILGRFLLEHGDTLAQRLRGIDAVVVVPSTARPAPHPLTTVLQELHPGVPVVPLLSRGSGALAFRRPSVDGYQVLADIASRRVLLVDDVYTTGARLNSAAHALRAAGHHVTGALVLARRVNTDYDPRAEAFWHAQTSIAYTWATSPVLAP